MLAKALNLNLNLKKISTKEGEHLTPEFLKINPQHTIPTLVDEGFALWESRAILQYMVENYAIKDVFYSKDAHTRATVNRLLYFDMGSLYKSFSGKSSIKIFKEIMNESIFSIKSEYIYPICKTNEAGDPEKLKKIHETLAILDIFLGTFKYAASDDITIADFALVATISTFEACGFDFKKFPNIDRWYELCKTTLPGIEANQEGVEIMKNIVVSFKDKLAFNWNPKFW